MVICKNCDIEVFWSWDGKWIHCESPNCGQPEPKKYPSDARDRTIDSVVRKKEEDNIELL
jgi:hypothetical protein